MDVHRNLADGGSVANGIDWHATSDGQRNLSPRNLLPSHNPRCRELWKSLLNYQPRNTTGKAAVPGRETA